MSPPSILRKRKRSVPNTPNGSSDLLQTPKVSMFKCCMFMVFFDCNRNLTDMEATLNHLLFPSRPMAPLLSRHLYSFPQM